MPRDNNVAAATLRCATIAMVVASTVGYVGAVNAAAGRPDSAALGATARFKVALDDRSPRLGRNCSNANGDAVAIHFERINRAAEHVILRVDAARATCAEVASATWQHANLRGEPCQVFGADGAVLLHCETLAEHAARYREMLSPPSSTDRSRRQATADPPMASWTAGGTLHRGLMYHNMDLILSRMKSLAAAYPGLVSVFPMGSSIEQANSIVGMRISTSPTVNDPQKPEVFIVGTHHAREWIAAEVPIGIAEMLCGLYYRNARVRRVMRRLEFIVIPVVNPDGYRYSTSINDGYHRYWRKNRRGTWGVDLNRNYPVYYGLDSGSSSDPSDETFRGTGPSSEPEVQSLEQIASNATIMSNVALYISYHNYGQDVLWPYGEDGNHYSPIESMMAGLFTHAAVSVMSRSEQGMPYSASKASSLYPVSGDAVDYMHKTFNNVPGITVELRPTEQFDLPVNEINATVIENIAAVLFLAEYSVASIDQLRDATYKAAWWNAPENAGYDEQRVPAIDRNADGFFDWFGVCDPSLTPTPANAPAPAALRVATAFDNVMPPWQVASRSSVNPATGAAVACANTSDVPSVLGSAGYSRKLRLLVDAKKVTSAGIASGFQGESCAVDLAQIGPLIAAAVASAYPYRGSGAGDYIGVEMDASEGATNRTMQLTTGSVAKTVCAVAFRIAVSPQRQDLVDDFFAASVAKIVAGTWESSGAAVVALLDAAYDTSVTSGVALPPSVTAVSAATTTTTAPLPVYTYTSPPRVVVVSSSAARRYGVTAWRLLLPASIFFAVTMLN